jgi:RNA polymerase sigma factor (sigma-70 family)
LQSWDDLEQLYLRYSRSVYRRARELLVDDEAARDATQEVFMRVIRAGGKLPLDPTPTAWLHCVTTNFCLNQLRDRKRRNDLLTKYPPGREVAPNGEARAVLFEILNRVPEELQDIAVYFFLDELTYDEIGRLIGVSRRTVSNRLAAFRGTVDSLFPNLRLAQ